LAVKCDRCESEATVHEVTIKAGKRHERHLCESCAKADGLPGQTHAPITQLLTQYITSQVQASGIGSAKGAAGGAPPPGTPSACPGCGHSHGQFRQTGLLGCPACYTAFEGQLSPLLARAHDGGTHHTGKAPMRLRGPQAQAVPAAHTAARGVAVKMGQPPAPDPAAVIAGLRKQLAEAIAAEKYELAAAFRDKLRRLEHQPPPGDGGARA
jgi:protein arginine kinase activator